MKEPITCHGREGKALFTDPLNFENAAKTYIHDAISTNGESVVVAAGVANTDGAFADLIAEVGADGIRRVIRTSPFYPIKVCAADKGTVWAYGMELTEDRKSELRAHYPMLREFSFEKGQLRSALDRGDVHLSPGIPLVGSRDELQMRCNAEKLVILNGPAREFAEYNFATSELDRRPLAPLPDGVNINRITGAALTDSGKFYVSTYDAPHIKALTRILQIHLNESGIVDWLPVAANPGNGHWFVLMGSDGEDLVYSLGRQTPTLFWAGRETTK